MSEKPFSVRLSDEEKEVLERIAKSKGMTMADVVRMWITKGDVVNILAEQLNDLSKDFAEWHLSNRSSSVIWLGRYLMKEPPIEEIGIIQNMFESEGGRLKKEFAEYRSKLNAFVNRKEVKEKKSLATFIAFFVSTVERYESLIRYFYEIAAIVSERNRDRIEKEYTNEFRVRFNEFAVKYEDFLKRSSRELGEDFERTLRRVKEFPEKREPWGRAKSSP